mmetsp:Transcript_25190/g.81471  ORF Transcript_25190/g.81471 Transcript_25190/m.81471 type:complete len:209 (-) Transcript_25190:188-814(-)
MRGRGTWSGARLTLPAQRFRGGEGMIGTAGTSNPLYSATSRTRRPGAVGLAPRPGARRRGSDDRWHPDWGRLHEVPRAHCWNRRRLDSNRRCGRNKPRLTHRGWGDGRVWEVFELDRRRDDLVGCCGLGTGERNADGLEGDVPNRRAERLEARTALLTALLGVVGDTASLVAFNLRRASLRVPRDRRSPRWRASRSMSAASPRRSLRR